MLPFKVRDCTYGVIIKPINTKMPFCRCCVDLTDEARRNKPDHVAWSIKLMPTYPFCHKSHRLDTSSI